MKLQKLSKILIKYVRDKNKKPIGVVIAIDSNKIGWSMCHKYDRWNKEMGKTIAINRAWNTYSLEEVLKHSPKLMHNDIKNMYERSKKYFSKND